MWHVLFGAEFVDHEARLPEDAICGVQFYKYSWCVPGGSRVWGWYDQDHVMTPGLVLSPHRGVCQSKPACSCHLEEKNHLLLSGKTAQKIDTTIRILGVIHRRPSDSGKPGEARGGSCSESSQLEAAAHTQIQQEAPHVPALA